jgi:hypothetical protein
MEVIKEEAGVRWKNAHFDFPKMGLSCSGVIDV